MKLIVIFFLHLSITAYGYYGNCNKKEIRTSDLVKEIKRLKKEATNLHLDQDLATSLMIASVTEAIIICAPAKNTKFSKSWGWFVPQDENKPKKIIFWEGPVRDKKYLNEASLLLSQNKHPYDELKLAWVNEKLGDFDKAIHLYGKTYKTQSQKIGQTVSCKEEQCEELMATSESLKGLLRIYEIRKDEKEILKLKKLINEYEQKRVFSDVLI
ncbi:hypothetical protein ACJVC5_08405 [Peredibacter sp. HCB2-198]|uniref:hypothetical protein n=1 Tax=Peredibacter sp. HCB2-198 TaxID=3383025 RepID=UPI0038B57C39